MFLDALMRRNPALVDVSVELHRRGVVPPGTFVIDVDRVEENARVLADVAKENDLALYFMTKQFGRNPILAKQIARWIKAAVAVDFDDVIALARAGVRIGHVGHLVQPPAAAVARVLSLEPEVVTVFSVQKARQVSDAARRLGREQRVLLRVVDRSDWFFPGQEGGIPLDRVESIRDEIDALGGVRVVGVTTYPAFKLKRKRYEPTANLETLVVAARRLGNVEQINAPGHTSVAVLPLLRAAGATHGEPGHALTGTTPLGAREDIIEQPAACFLTEVSHFDEDRVSVFGGGFYDRSVGRTGLLSHGGRRVQLSLEPFPKGLIDYYRHLARDGCTVDVGDSVVFSFRFQIFTSRARVATVTGVNSGQPELIGLHDAFGREFEGTP